MKADVENHAEENRKLAELYKVSLRTVQRWRARQYPLHDEKRMRATLDAQHTSGSGSEELRAAKLELMILQCKRLDQQYQRERALYVTIEEVKHERACIENATRIELQRLATEIPTWSGLPAIEMSRRADALMQSISANLHDVNNPNYCLPVS
jgi:phage terminase Nu1 subunit (DNA packaging protein)